MFLMYRLRLLDFCIGAFSRSLAGALFLKRPVCSNASWRSLYCLLFGVKNDAFSSAYNCGEISLNPFISLGVLK